MNKRMFALLLAVIMMASMLSVSAAAAAPTSGNIGYNISWHLDLSTGTLTFQGRGNLPDYISKTAPPWSGHSNSIKYVRIPTGIERIGNLAFHSCQSLESVICEGQGLKSVGESAFAYCYKLELVFLSNTVESIGEKAFYYCESLKNINLPTKLTSIENETFFNCDSLEKAVIPKKVIRIGEGAFYGCNSLKTVEISESVTDIGKEAFMDCSKLETLNIPQGVTRIQEGTFDGASQLKELTIPVSVTVIEQGAFSGLSMDEIGIVYEGSCDQWRAISVADNNTMLKGAKVKMTHDTVVRNRREATCVTEGYTGDQYCEGCNLVVKSGKSIPVTDHVYSNWKCTVCGAEDPAVSDNPFEDVFVSDWYFRPVLWAVGANVTGGKTANTFAPNESCTRAQVVTFLWAANGKPNPKSSANPFDDVSTGDWYYKPVLWAVENGITGGVAPHEFGPNRTCTRAQVVTFLWAAEGKPDPESNYNPFEDVSGSAWYLKPVLWAVENEITSGVDNDKFGSEQSCTRAQVVTFLNKVYG